MKKETYLYFGEDTLGASATAVCLPVSRFLGAYPSGNAKIKLAFQDIEGAANDNTVELTFTTTAAHIKAMEAIASAMNTNEGVRSNIVTIYDGVTGATFPINNYKGTAQAFTAVDLVL